MATNSVQKRLLTRDDAISILLASLFKRASKGTSVLYSLIEENEKIFSFSAALEDGDSGHLHKPVDCYRIEIDRVSGEMGPLVLISLSRDEIADVIFRGTGQHLSEYGRFNDGALSISYKVSVVEDPHAEYVVQLRHHGDVASMNAIMKFVSTSVNPSILPVPQVYPTGDERERQQKTRMGIQTTRFIPGVLASEVYPSMPHEDKLLLVRKIALAFDVLWRLPLPDKRLIGELKATHENDAIRLYVGPDRHYSLGGPFESVADYLRAKVRGSLDLFRKQNGIDEYKDRYLQRVTDFVETGMLNIPDVVEQIPVVPMHSDMGLHNIIISSTKSPHIMGIIDWEFCASAPYAIVDRLLEVLFRRWSPNGHGKEYACADELRHAFWDAIPEWKRWNESEATKVFLEWFRFASFMKAEPLHEYLNVDKEIWWSENIRITESFLDKYHCIEL